MRGTPSTTNARRATFLALHEVTSRAYWADTRGTFSTLRELGRRLYHQYGPERLALIDPRRVVQARRTGRSIKPLQVAEIQRLAEIGVKTDDVAELLAINQSTVASYWNEGGYVIRGGWPLPAEAVEACTGEPTRSSTDVHDPDRTAGRMSEDFDVAPLIEQSAPEAEEVLEDNEEANLPVRSDSIRPAPLPRRLLSPEDANDIVELFRAGVEVEELAEHYHCSEDLIRSLLRTRGILRSNGVFTTSSQLAAEAQEEKEVPTRDEDVDEMDDSDGQDANAGWPGVRRLTDEQISTMLFDYRAGMPIWEIEQKHGVTAGTLYKYVHRYKLPLRLTRLDDDMIVHIHLMWMHGSSASEIAAELKIDRGTVYRQLQNPRVKRVGNGVVLS